jgi:peptide/nickel transport system permease protein
MIALRIVALPVLLFIVATLTFFLVHALPGDPARDIAGAYATPAVLQQIRQQLGIAAPLGTQYTTFLDQLMHGSLGTSYTSHDPVTTDIATRIMPTVELAIAAVLFAVVWGLLLGFIGAWWANRRPDSVVRGVVSIEQAIPDFVAGLVLIFLLTFKTGVLPQPTGQLGLLDTSPPSVTHAALIDALLAGQWPVAWQAFLHLVLPAISLGFVIAAAFARLGRSTMKSALEGPQIEFARACGLRRRQILYYASTVARTPLITLLAMVGGAILGGTAIVENVFSWGGLASWGVDSITHKDVPAVLGFVLVTGAITIVAFLILDIVVLLLDPRVRR